MSYAGSVGATDADELDEVQRGLLLVALAQQAALVEQEVERGGGDPVARAGVARLARVVSLLAVALAAPPRRRGLRIRAL